MKCALPEDPLKLIPLLVFAFQHQLWRVKVKTKRLSKHISFHLYLYFRFHSFFRSPTYLVSVFREGVSTGHHQGGPLFQLPQPLSSLVQGNASSGQFSHHPACCCLHALHSALSRDVLCQAAGCLTRRCLTNCRAGAIKQNKAVLLLLTKIKTKKGKVI